MGPQNLDVFIVNNLVFRWPKPLFFMVLGGSWYILAEHEWRQRWGSEVDRSGTEDEQPSCRPTSEPPKQELRFRRFRLDSRSSCLQEVTPALTLGVQGVPTVGRSSSTKTAHGRICRSMVFVKKEFPQLRKCGILLPWRFFWGDAWNIVECFFC